jgi:hypothetical protein
MPRRPANSSPRPPAKPRRLAPRNSAANSRLFVYLMVMFLIRADRLRRRVYDKDIDLAVLAETIAVGAIDPRMREPAFRQRFQTIDKVAGVKRQRAVNALSIAATAGIPRETTRRKIKKLVEMDVLTETGRGQYVLTPGYLQSATQRRLFAELTDEAMRFFNECLEERLIELPRRR